MGRGRRCPRRRRPRVGPETTRRGRPGPGRKGRETRGSRGGSENAERPKKVLHVSPQILMPKHRNQSKFVDICTINIV